MTDHHSGELPLGQSLEFPRNINRPTTYYVLLQGKTPMGEPGLTGIKRRKKLYLHDVCPLFVKEYTIVLRVPRYIREKINRFLLPRLQFHGQEMAFSLAGSIWSADHAHEMGNYSDGIPSLACSVDICHVSAVATLSTGYSLEV